MAPNEISFLFNGFQSTGSALSDRLVNLTRHLNEVTGSNAVDRFMDSASGIGHRIQFGHSLDYLPVIYKKFGVTGVGEYFSHLFKDVMSPHGIPVPFALQIKNALGLSTTNAIDWLCFNIGDLVSGSLSVTHSVMNFMALKSAVSSGYLSPYLLASSTFGAVSKVVFSILTPNPIGLVAGIFDIGVTIWAVTPAISLGSKYFVKTTILSKSAMVSVSEGAIMGAASAGFIGGLMNFSKLRSSPREWAASVKRYSFSGMVAGIAGATAAVALAKDSYLPVIAATTAGYVVGETTFDSLKEKFSFRKNSELLDA